MGKKVPSIWKAIDRHGNVERFETVYEIAAFCDVTVPTIYSKCKKKIPTKEGWFIEREVVPFPSEGVKNVTPPEERPNRYTCDSCDDEVAYGETYCPNCTMIKEHLHKYAKEELKFNGDIRIKV